MLVGNLGFSSPSLIHKYSFRPLRPHSVTCIKKVLNEECRLLGCGAVYILR
jgi:hypothetical protein